MFKQWINEEKIPLVTLLAVFILLTVITWNKWAELDYFDNTKEILVPYLMNHGLRLYNDISYVYGPLTVIYFYSMIKLFGVRLEIFYWTGLMLVFIYTYILYLTARIVLSKFSATIASLLFLCQLVFFNTGLYGLIFPYAYASVLGGFLLVLELLLLGHCIKFGEKKIYLWLVAAIITISFANKQDFFLGSFSLLVFYFLLLPIVDSDTFKGLSIKESIKLYWSRFKYSDFIKIISFIIGTCVLLMGILISFIGVDRTFEALFPFQVVNDPAFKELSLNAFRSSPSFTNFVDFMAYGIASPLMLLIFIVLIYFIIEGFSRIKTRILTLIIILSLFLFSIYIKYPDDQEYTIFSWLITALIQNAKNIYFGINLWILILLFYSLFHLKSLENKIIVLYCFSALIMDYRMFFRLHLENYAFYYLAIAVILFCYILSKPLNNLVIKENSINAKSWSLSIKVLMIILVVFYMLISLGLYGIKNIKEETSYGTVYFRKLNYDRYNAIKRVAKYIKNHSNENDTILAYPGLPIVYLLANRLPASRHHFAIPTSISNQRHKQELFNDIKNKKPQFILISSEDLGFGFGSFGSKSVYPDIFAYILKHYSKIKTFTSKNCFNDKYHIDLYKYKTP